jgi:hypothetical protein
VFQILRVHVLLSFLLQPASSFDGMGNKGKVADVSDAFGVADTMSIGDVFGKKQKKSSRKSADPPKDAGSKRAKISSVEEPVPTRPAPAPAASPDASVSKLQGKSRFYAESIRLSDSLVRRQLFGHGELWLTSRPGDYDEMKVYSGSSSSGEMSPAKEETYRIARSLGAASSSRVIANADLRTVGLLPDKAVADFADACAGSFVAPEVERDLLKVTDSSLAKAINFHSVSVRTCALFRSLVPCFFFKFSLIFRSCLS